MAVGSHEFCRTVYGASPGPSRQRGRERVPGESCGDKNKFHIAKLRKSLGQTPMVYRGAFQMFDYQIVAPYNGKSVNPDR
jgi:hypothetical protein